MRIKFGDVRIGEVARKHINECLDNNWITEGKKVAEFEKKWADLAGASYCTIVNSGTTADIAMCASLYDLVGAKRGYSEVIVPALSFVATQNSVLAAGLVPVYCDVDWDMNIDVNQVEKLINDRTVGILAVSLMGKPFNAIKLKVLCKKYGLKLLADQCEAHFAKYQGLNMEDFADACAYSFYSAHIVFSGQQGAVTSHDKKICDLVKSIKTHGRRNAQLFFEHVVWGMNGNPIDLCASVGLESLANSSWIFNKRKENLNKMINVLKKYKDLIVFTEEEDGDVNSPHAFSVTFKKPGLINGLKKHLNEKEIEWKRNFGSVSKHKSFQDLGCKPGDYPIAEWIGDNGLHTACHQFLNEEDVDYIINSYDEYLHKC